MKLEGRVVTEHGVDGARLTLAGSIMAIEPMRVASDAPLVLPGFVDLHVHGGGGGDVMQGAEGVRALARHHLRHGTTALLPTTYTAPFEQIEAALLGVEEVMRAPRADEALVLGGHLEGPFINSGRLGAQPSFARAAESWEVDRLLDLGPIRVATFAPEIEGSDLLLDKLLEADVRPQLGHTGASFAEATRALDLGATGFTHLFNAMSGMHQRAGGTVAAALARAEFAEIIVDLEHVTRPALESALRCVPCLYAVTDAVACCGMPDGQHRVAGANVVKRAGVVRSADGTLAGSVLTMDQALRNLVSIGVSLPEATRRLSAYPCAYLGLADRGRIAVGARADLLVMSPDLELEAVLLGGTIVHSAINS